MEDFRICSNAQCQLNWYTGKCGMSSSRSLFNWNSTDGFQVSFFGKKSGSRFFGGSFVWEKSTSGVQLGETSIGKWSYRKATWISHQGGTGGHHYYLLQFELRWCEVAKYSSPERDYFSHLFSATIQIAEMPKYLHPEVRIIGRNATLVWQSIRLHSYATAEIKAFMMRSSWSIMWGKDEWKSLGTWVSGTLNSHLLMGALIGMMNQIFTWEMAVSPFPSNTLNWLALGSASPVFSPGAYLLTSLTVIVGNQILGKFQWCLLCTSLPTATTTTTTTTTTTRRSRRRRRRTPHPSCHVYPIFWICLNSTPGCICQGSPDRIQQLH